MMHDAVCALRCLVLEMGFRPAVEKIMARLPAKSKRQTLLFSATMPKQVQGIAGLALSEQYSYIDTVSSSSDDNDLSHGADRELTHCAEI